MSDHVIITGVRRANEFVPIAEIKQMAGRAGRTQDGRAYQTDIILHDEDYPIEKELEEDKALEIKSQFSNIRNFSFAVLPKITSYQIRDEVDIKSFYDRSFASYQEQKLDLSKVLEFLEQNEAIVSCKKDGINTFIPSPLGVIASELYMHVSDVKLLVENFKKVIADEELENDGALAWALGNLDTIKINGDFGEDHRQEISRFKSDMPYGYECSEGCVITSALWWCMLGNGIAGKNMATNIRQLKKTWIRLKFALTLSIGDRYQSLLEELNLRISRGLRKELVPFFENPEMTKGRAELLASMGYHNWEEAKDVVLEEDE